MVNKYFIRVVNTKSGQVSYFDRIKTSYGMSRVITSSTLKGKCYSSMETAEAELRVIRPLFSEEYTLDVESIEGISVVIGNGDDITDYI